ncbi:1-phosphofructokinase family hexose kinase [Acidithiobacillus concretivorus]|uniref:Phosphofructokinase n=1 Tax=Acidithiobacillus concretivorus TaxID=3063952 RepID=A0ABS5ZSW5_9PROT|nr:1-phosphofructokinase family hexose kinase [Acidithiobacillus concretivorus]MBU2739776.1 1-phosphofructokinase family hexose kinase [Acidithiobacillus concretivorus]
MTESEPCQAIATLTLNPAVDIAYEVPHLIPDQKSLALTTRYDPGGNGVNVARALKELLVCAHSCCIVAGNIGDLLQKLLQHQLDSPHCVRVEGETRVNATILQGDPPAQFEVTGIGPLVSELALSTVKASFLELCKGGYAVLTGSVPPGVPDHIYGDMVDQVQADNGKAIVDAHGALLQMALPHQPYLIKPNRYELSVLRQRELPTLEDVAQEARTIQREGVQYVCISLGGDGALLVGPDGSYLAKAPAIAVKSTVGAGDSMVAGLVAALARQQSPAEALRLAVACGSGTAARPGTEIFTHSLVVDLLQQVNVKVLDI